MISTLDKAISEIEKAGCPLDNPEVKKVLDPIKNLKTEISGATAQAAPKKENTTSTQAPSAAPVPTVSPSVANTNTNTGNSPAKLSYPCRQVLKRQSGKPKAFERELGPLREAIKSGKTVGSIQPGLMVEHKIDAALSDLNNSSCPKNHPDVKSVLDQLNAQKKDVPVIYAELKKRLDQFAKKADVGNYPEYEKDTEIFEVINKRYRYTQNLYNQNIDLKWVEGIGKMGFNRNIKSPIYKYDQLKNLLENMVKDGEAYNAQMKLVESKYKELFSANRILAGKYVRARDGAAKTLGGFYKNDLESLKKILAVTIDHNLKVLDLSIKKSMETRSPEFFRGDTLKHTLKHTNEAITLFSLTGKENREKAPKYKSQMEEINKRLKETQSALAEVMLKEQRLGKEKYTGSDIEKIRSKITEKFKEYYPKKELIKVQMVNEDWKVTDYVSWSSGNAYRHHYSELGFYAVVKETSDVAILVGGWYNVNHQQRNKVSVNFNFHKASDMYQNRKILIKNL